MLTFGFYAAVALMAGLVGYMSQIDIEFDFEQQQSKRP